MEIKMDRYVKRNKDRIVDICIDNKIDRWIEERVRE